jgi:antitoxin FitA
VAGNLLIRGVPDDVRDALAERAARRGQSLQAYLLELVSADARRNVNLPLLRAVRDVGGGLDEPVDLAAVRAERRLDG